MGTLAKMLLIVLTLIGSGLANSRHYYGFELGRFVTRFHDVTGEVYAVNEKTLFVKNFNYDGKGGDAVFWVGLNSMPDDAGFSVLPNRESTETLKPYFNEDVLLRMPDGIKINQLKWLSVWSRKFSVSFGTIFFPPLLIIPQPAFIGTLNSTRQGTSSGTILIIDTQTFLISDFSYDGSGTDVHWWISKSDKPDSDAIQLQDEDGKNSSLQERKNKTVFITLPDKLFVTDYNFLILWDNDVKEKYGFVKIPRVLYLPPPLRTLEAEIEAKRKINCEMLNDDLGLEVRWFVSANDIIIDLVGNLEDSEYIMFGLSKHDLETRFDSADAAVAWIDKDGKGHADDYYLESTERCVNGHGMCPDDIHEGFSNNLLLLNATQFNKLSVITFKRTLKAEDKIYDQHVYTDGPQAVLWAVGPIEEGNLPGTPKLHSRGNLLLDFGRDPTWNCPPLSAHFSTKAPVEQHQFAIHCPSDHTFRAQMGPHTNKNYTYVWYINGLPTPELTVQRGQEYTFIVEGGMGPSIRNPLYITNSSEGGIYQNLLEGTDSYENVFAGVHHDVTNGLHFPTSEGRLCLWSVSDQDPEHSVTTSFSDSISALTLSCEPGNYAKLSWTPDADTPDTAYYQSFTEKHLGGKIRVLDFCEETALDSYIEEEKNSSPIRNEGSRIKGNKFKPELEREGDLKKEKPSSSLENSSEVTEKESELESEMEEVDEKYKNIINKMPESDESLSGMKNQRSAAIIDEQANDDNSYSIGTFQVGNNAEKIEIFGPSQMKEPLQLEISQPLLSDSLHPHDESERSDKNIHHHQNTKTETTINHNKIPVGNYSSQEKPLMKQQTPSVNIPQKEVVQTPRQPERFKPQFQGGFVPLVLNPVKEKESSISLVFEYPPPHFPRPHRPFLFNESIPFHGTFKPGVPDFSGFNISHYSQDESYPLNHVLDHLPELSASNPQMIHRPLTSINDLTPELFHRRAKPLQIRKIFRYMPHPKASGLGFLQQPTGLAEIPNVRHPNFPEEDLKEVSSQRVQVAFQASLEGKGKNNEMSHMQMAHTQDKNKLQTNNKIHAPPIQRRPDFIGEEGSLSSSLFKPNQFPERLNIKNNENLDNQRGSAVMKLNGHRNPFNIRGPMPVIKPRLNGMERDKIPTRIPFREFQRKPNPFLQNSEREMAPPFSGSHRNAPFHQRIPHRAERPRDSMPIMSSNNQFRVIPQMVNPIVNSAENYQRIKIPDELNGPASKEQEMLPLFLNAEIAQHSAKNSRPQLLTSHTNTRNIPNIKMSPNRLQMTQRPIFHLKEETVKKFPMPMDEFKQQSISQPAIAPNHSSSEKQQVTLELKPSDMKADLTVPHTSDSFASGSNEDQRSKLQSIEINSSIAEVQSDEIEQESTRKKENERNDDNSSEEGDIKPNWYLDYDVPFGARLNSTQMGNRPFHRKQYLTSPSFIDDTHQISAPFTESGVEKVKAATVSQESSANYSTTEANKEDAVYTVLESFPRKEILSPTEDDLKVNNSSDEQKFESLFLSDDALEKQKGRKNIIPNFSETGIKFTDTPPRVPEHINLPHISEKPPSHDNGTDYSILNHVLSLIRGPP